MTALLSFLFVAVACSPKARVQAAIDRRERKERTRRRFYTNSSSVVVTVAVHLNDTDKEKITGESHKRPLNASYNA